MGRGCRAKNAWLRKEPVHSRPVSRLIDYVLDALDWFDQIAVASLRAIWRTLVEGFTAYGLSVSGFDPEIGRYSQSPSEIMSEMEAAPPGRPQFQRDYESVDDLVRSLRLKVGSDLHGENDDMEVPANTKTNAALPAAPPRADTA